MNEHNQKILTLSNRTYIEPELLQKSTFSSIAKSLHKDPTTISKEVKRYYKTIPAKHSYRCYICKHLMLLMPKNNTRRSFMIHVKVLT